MEIQKLKSELHRMQSRYDKLELEFTKMRELQLKKELTKNDEVMEI